MKQMLSIVPDSFLEKLNEKQDQIINLLKINLIFILSILLSNINVIYGIIYDGPFHRQLWEREYFNLLNFLKSFMQNLFKIPSGLNHDFANNLPFLLFFPFLYFFSLIKKNKKIYLIFFTLIFAKLSLYFVNTQ